MESFLNYIDYCTTSDFVLKICITINPEMNYMHLATNQSRHY